MKNSPAKSEKHIIDLSFEIALLLKGLLALGEVLSGGLLLFLTPGRMNGLIRWFTQGELQEDPKDLIANFLVNWGQHFTVSAQMLAAIYLLGHGLIKLITILLLWRRVLWAYPLSIVIFLGFIIYQLAEFFGGHHSVFLILVTLLDLLMIVLTWLEYRDMRGKWKLEKSIKSDR